MLKTKSDAIVRIISNNVEPDIFSPYKIQSDGESIGTGFFINSDGYILTCAHVVDSSIKIWINVQSEGKKKIQAIVHSICYDKDLAILKTVNYVNKHFCKLGDSDKIKQEDNVTAVGYPLGQDRLKKTRGIVSGTQDRHIQTDTPINPGNSGGPLFNSDTEVIGINTSKIMSLVAENIGYATPINDFINFSKLMFNPPPNKIVTEPILYCEIQNTTENHCKLFKCPEKPGVIIKTLIENSPMYMSGLRENDILIQFDKYKLDGNGDTDVTWSDDKVSFYDLIAKYAPDTEFEIIFWSTAQQKMINAFVKLNNDSLYKIRHIRYPYEKIDYEIFAGMIVMELNMDHIKNAASANFPPDIIFSLQKYRNIKKRTDNIVFISNILQGSYMSTLDGIRAGSIIKNVNGQCISTLEDFRIAMATKSINVDGNYLAYVKLEDRNQIILDLKQSFDEEMMLSERYKYTISSLYGR